MSNGWVKVHRKLLENPVFKNDKCLRLWIYLLLKATHRPDKIIWNDGVLRVKEGQLVTGRKQIALDTGLTESSIERLLKFLENEHQIEQQKTTKFRIITIVKWSEYQETDNKPDNKRTTKRQQTDTYKNVKNDKNKTTTPETGDGGLVNEAINLFKDVNPNYRVLYARPPQRAALTRLIEINGFEKLSKVIGILPQSNKIPYLPTITTPIQLEERWAALESGLVRKKVEITSKGRGLA